MCASLLVSEEICRTRPIVNQAINGDPTLIALERALHELRCGRAIYCRGPLTSADRSADWLLACAETASSALMARMQRHGASDLALVLTRQRVAALGIDLPATAAGATSDSDAVILQLRQPLDATAVRALAGLEPLTAAAPLDAVQAALCDASLNGAITLAKRARLLPALLAVTAAGSSAEALLEVSTQQLDQLISATTSKLERISEARVPLAGNEDCRLVLFRDVSTAAEHVAIVIGTADPNTPTPVRLHSACLTGDLLGSLRCDCGDQLRGAVRQLTAAGGGVLLYLAQEGRGIGLANKLRAYALQDTGLDTLQADRSLGFNADERQYQCAADMLRQLGLTRIALFTNSPQKIAALRGAGIEVVSDQRLLGGINRHNIRYIHAKREHAGHLIPEIDLENADEMSCAQRRIPD